MTEKTSSECCTHRRQETRNWCVQACLQSFLFDNGARNWTQNQMVELGVREKFCDDRPEKRGVIPYDQGRTPEYSNLIDFCALLDIHLEKIEYEQMPQKPSRGEGVLILIWKYKGNPDVQHCVRFCDRVDENRVRVMNPSPEPDEFPVWEDKQIRNCGCHVFKVRLRKP